MPFWEWNSLLTMPNLIKMEMSTWKMELLWIKTLIPFTGLSQLYLSYLPKTDGQKRFILTLELAAIGKRYFTSFLFISLALLFYLIFFLRFFWRISMKTVLNYKMMKIMKMSLNYSKVRWNRKSSSSGKHLGNTSNIVLKNIEKKRKKQTRLKKNQSLYKKSLNFNKFKIRYIIWKISKKDNMLRIFIYKVDLFTFLMLKIVLDDFYIQLLVIKNSIGLLSQ